MVSISISLTPELLAALDKLKGTIGRSKYIAELISERASQSSINVENPKVITRTDIVKQAVEAFKEAHGRMPAMAELQQITKLSYQQVWNAVRTLGITPLNKVEYEMAKKIEAERERQEQERQEQLRKLREWYEHPTTQGLSLERTYKRSAVRIAGVFIELYERYDKIDEKAMAVGRLLSFSRTSLV